MKLSQIFKVANLYKRAANVVTKDVDSLAETLEQAKNEAIRSQNLTSSSFFFKDTKYSIGFNIYIADLTCEEVRKSPETCNEKLVLKIFALVKYDDPLIQFPTTDKETIFREEVGMSWDLLAAYIIKVLENLDDKETILHHHHAHVPFDGDMSLYTPVLNPYNKNWKSYYQQMPDLENDEDHKEPKEYKQPEQQKQHSQYEGQTPEFEEERARKQQHALDLLSRPAPKRYASLFNLANKFMKKYSMPWFRGKDYIQQKEDGTLIVDNVVLDRNKLNAMKSWQDLVDMKVSEKIVSEIAREYGGHPKDVDFWLERNSIPYQEPEEDKQGSLEEVIRETFKMLFYQLNDKVVTGERSAIIHLSQTPNLNSDILSKIKHKDEFEISVGKFGRGYDIEVRHTNYPLDSKIIFNFGFNDRYKSHVAKVIQYIPKRISKSIIDYVYKL